MRYELFYLVGASKEAELEKIKSDVAEMITSQGGVFEEKETLEKRRLAYEVKHENQGIYIARRFELESEKIKEIIRKLNLYTGVLRFVLSRADELPELKSKEERIAEAKLAASKEMEAAELKKEEQEKEKTVEKTEKMTEEEKKTESQEDMDKKLEEILNI